MMQSLTKSNWFYSLAFIFLIVFSFSLRSVLIDQSFWLDEAAQVLESQRPLSQQLNIRDDFQPPLFHVLVHFMIGVSKSESWLRLLPVVAGVGTVLGTWQFGKLMHKKQWSGFIAAWLLNLSAFHIYFSQELRPYSLAAFFAVWSWIFLQKYIQHKTRASLFTYILLSIFGMYTMYLYAFVLVGQGLYMLAQKKVKLCFGTALAVGTAFAPWIPSFLGQLQASSALRIQMPNWGTAVSSEPIKGLMHLALRLLGGVQTYDGTPMELVYFGLPILLFTIIGTIVISQQKKWNVKNIFVHPYFWWGVGIFLAWCVSWFMPIFSPKRVLFVFPLWFLLVELFIAHISKSNIIKTTFVTFLTVHMMWGVSLYWTKPLLQRENWRVVYQLLQQAVHPDETLVLFREYEAFSPWVYYEQRYNAQFPTLALAPQHQVTDENLRMYQTKLLEYNQVVLFDYLADLTDSERKTEQWLASHGYKQEDALDAGLIGIIHLYRKEAVYADAQRWD